jgi:putative integral membrane protein (TIGR02587 family)
VRGVAAASGGSVLAREVGYLAALARAAAGALIFALPLFMTQEMWELGAGLERLRLVVFLVLAVPLLTGLTWYAGFREDAGWADALLDALAAYAVGFAVAAACLAMLGVLGPDRLSLAGLGTVAVQAVPAAFGAALAQSQLGGAGADEGGEERRREAGYWAELLLMVAGALFVTFNIAPTEEVQAITHGLAPWQCLVVVAVSLAVMHAFVYGVGFSGQETRPEHRGLLGEFALYTVTGYALALLTCLYMLWILGQIDDQEPLVVLKTMVVLGFPAALGASAARLIL